MKALRSIVAWVLGLISVAWRFSCRIQHHNDTRQPFFEEKQPFIIALLHAHMISALLSSSYHSAVMTSRSKDGDLIAPAVRLSGSKPVRGSSRKNGQSKGGEEALAQMSRLMKEESYNPVLTVDGPRGPRNFVHRGVAKLAFEHGCPVIPVTPLATRSHVLKKTWDKIHIPMPLSIVKMHWGEPMYPKEDESMDAFRARVGETLRQAELKLDPQNAQAIDDSQIQFV